jgi:hypothetical protein
MPPDEDWFIRRFPYRQDLFGIENLKRGGI